MRKANFNGNEASPVVDYAGVNAGLANIRSVIIDSIAVNDGIIVFAAAGTFADVDGAGVALEEEFVDQRVAAHEVRVSQGQLTQQRFFGVARAFFLLAVSGVVAVALAHRHGSHFGAAANFVARAAILERLFVGLAGYVGDDKVLVTLHAEAFSVDLAGLEGSGFADGAAVFVGHGFAGYLGGEGCPSLVANASPAAVFVDLDATSFRGARRSGRPHKSDGSVLGLDVILVFLVDVRTLNNYVSFV